MFERHPSAKLTELFKAKPYQGVSPFRCKFLFVGLDANYAPDIASSPIFEKLLGYHADGVKFWRQYGVHHPFLLPEYSGDGRYYHRSFAQIGFRPEHADQVSFVELLHVPTVGRNNLEATDLSLDHLLKINTAILEGEAHHIFLPSGVARLMRRTKIFSWLPQKPQPKKNSLGVFHRTGIKTVYSHLHFSVYGKFQEQKVRDAAQIRSLID